MSSWSVEYPARFLKNSSHPRDNFRPAISIVEKPAPGLAVLNGGPAPTPRHCREPDHLPKGCRSRCLSPDRPGGDGRDSRLAPGAVRGRPVLVAAHQGGPRTGRRIEGEVIEAQSGARGYVLTGDRCSSPTSAGRRRTWTRTLTGCWRWSPTTRHSRTGPGGSPTGPVRRWPGRRTWSGWPTPRAGQPPPTGPGLTRARPWWTACGPTSAEFLKEEERLDAEREADLGRIRRTG